MKKQGWLAGLILGMATAQSWGDSDAFDSLAAMSAQAGAPIASIAGVPAAGPAYGGLSMPAGVFVLRKDVVDRGSLPDNIPFFRGAPCDESCRQVSHSRREVSPVNTGFKALGPAGKTGKVDGPGRKGNGTYKVLKNDPYEIVLNIKTGYVDGASTMKRDPVTGADTIRFAGRLWDQSKGDLGPAMDQTSEAQITYDPRRNAGVVRWNENGAWKQEGYWGGKSGKKMTIEFGGGWDHDFKQD